jgi:hypothetical protein
MQCRILRVTNVDEEPGLDDGSEISPEPEPIDPPDADPPAVAMDGKKVEATVIDTPVATTVQEKKLETDVLDTPAAVTTTERKAEVVADESSATASDEDDDSDEDEVEESDEDGPDDNDANDQKTTDDQKNSSNPRVEGPQIDPGDEKVEGDQKVQVDSTAEDEKNSEGGDDEEDGSGTDNNSEDGSDDEDDEEDAEEGASARVLFQNRSLRDYFKDIPEDEEGLRSTAWEAHISILEKMVQILAETDTDQDDPPLAEYSSIYWHQHLMEIDIDDATDEGVKRVLLVLHDITTDKEDLSTVLETFTVANDLYPWLWSTAPDGAAPVEETWVDVMGRWAQRGKELEGVEFDPEMEEWVNGVAEDPYKALEDLARVHTRNWFAAEQLWAIKESFKFARAALRFVSSWS